MVSRGYIQAVDRSINRSIDQSIRYGTARTVTHESDRCAAAWLACVCLSAGEQTSFFSPRTAADANEGGDVEEASMTVSMYLCIYVSMYIYIYIYNRRENSARVREETQRAGIPPSEPSFGFPRLVFYSFARWNSYCVDRTGSHRSHRSHRYLFTREFFLFEFAVFISTG